MTLVQHLFNGTDGVAVTVAGTIGATEINTATGSAITFESDMGRNGTGLLMARASGQTCTARFAFASPNNQVQVTFEMTTPPSAHASGTVTLMSLRNASTQAGRIYIGTTGNLSFTDAGSTPTAVATGLSWNTRYRVSFVVSGGSTSASSIAIKVYPSGSGTAVGAGLNLTNANLTASPISHVQLGDSGGSAAYQYGFDELQMNDGSGSEIAQYTASNVAPTVNAGVDQNVSAAATVNLSASASDSDGTIASYAWTFDYPTSGAPTLTGGTTATPSFTAGSAGALYVLRCTVTDNSSATAFDTVEVRVPVSGSTEMRPLGQDGTGSAGWTIGGGSATEGAALNDSSDTTYVQSPAISGTAAPKRWRFQPSGDKTNPYLNLRLGMDTGTGNWTVRVYNVATGGTAIQTFTQNGVGTTATDYAFNITNTVSSDNWKQLWFEAQVVTP